MTLKPYVLPLLRLTTFLGVCLGATAYFGYRQAHASIGDQLLAFGQRMAPYLDDGHSTEAPRQMIINNQRMFMASGSTSAPPSAVRDWYSRRYMATGNAFIPPKDAPPPGELVDKHGAASEMPPGQVAFGNDDEGALAAIDFGGPMSRDELTERFKKFFKTYDMGAVGRLRYVYYRRLPGGGTSYLTAWTDDHFNIKQLGPQNGEDAPGADLDDVPRPPRSVRSMSVAERGQSLRVLIYRGDATPGEIGRFYQTELPRQGYAAAPRFPAQASPDHFLMVFNRQGHDIMISSGGSSSSSSGLELGQYTTSIVQLN